MYLLKKIAIILTLILFLNLLLVINVQACKDIIASGDATEGDYNLLIKVRDPSRPDLSVLCIVPESYEYTYHHPWTGKPITYTVKNKFIAACSKEDIMPNIVKPGMAFSDVGISYGEADSYSKWVNPTKFGWDDFDWLRYTCQEADTESEAVKLITEDVVDKLRAPAVSANLFITGPKESYIVESDSKRYDIKKVEDIVVMQNYPKELWKNQILRRLFISKSFDTEKERWVRKNSAVRLNAPFGIRIAEIGTDYIIVRPIIFKIGDKVKINIGESKNVGNFRGYGSYRVTLHQIDGKKAKISMCSEYKAWEEKIRDHIEPRIGSITIRDMMNWSRLHKEDLDGLRGMCQENRDYESAMIFKIPYKDYELLSEGWFSANRPCSSIYVPVHICVSDIFEPYKTGKAAQLTLDLLEIYEHNYLKKYFSQTENVFLTEIELVNTISLDLSKNEEDISEFLTIIDMGMQRQAYMTEQMWLDVNNNQEIIDIISQMWQKNYSYSLFKMKNAITELENFKSIKERVTDLALDICKTRIDAAESIGIDVSLLNDDYIEGKNNMLQGKHETGFNEIYDTFEKTNMLLKGQKIPGSKESINKKTDAGYLTVILFLIIVMVVVFLTFLKRRK